MRMDEGNKEKGLGVDEGPFFTFGWELGGNPKILTYWSE